MKSRNDQVIYDRRFISEGQTLIKEGEYGQQAYLIQSGEVSVSISKDGAEVEVARLGPGQILGEMALIFDSPRTASIKAVSDCNLIIIGRQQFQEKLQASDPTIRAIVKMLSSRVLDTNNSLINKKGGLGDLKDAARVIYQNIAAGLPQNQAWNFKNTVLPQLEALFDSIENFKDRYNDPSS